MNKFSLCAFGQLQSSKMAFDNLLRVLLLGLGVSQGLAQTLTADMITSMGNKSLFTRWRSYSRIISPAGWMNVSLWDPISKTHDQSDMNPGSLRPNV